MNQQESEKQSSRNYKFKWWQFLLVWAVVAGIGVMWDGEFTLPRFETYVVCNDLSQSNPGTHSEKIDPTQNAFYCGGMFYADVEQKIVYRTSSQKYQQYLMLKNGHILDNNDNIDFSNWTNVYIPGED